MRDEAFSGAARDAHGGAFTYIFRRRCFRPSAHFRVREFGHVERVPYMPALYGPRPDSAKQCAQWAIAFR